MTTTEEDGAIRATQIRKRVGHMREAIEGMKKPPHAEWRYVRDVSHLLDRLASLEAREDDLLEAAKAMDALMDNLWEAVPWGDTFGLDIKRLNEAPLVLKKAIAKVEDG